MHPYRTRERYGPIMTVDGSHDLQVSQLKKSFGPNRVLKGISLAIGARVCGRVARILVIDETTSTLPPTDANRVIASLGAAAKAGATVIMVTHKLSEILHATDRVLMLIDGELVADAPTKGLDRTALVE